MSHIYPNNDDVDVTQLFETTGPGSGDTSSASVSGRRLKSDSSSSGASGEKRKRSEISSASSTVPTLLSNKTVRVTELKANVSKYFQFQRKAAFEF